MPFLPVEGDNNNKKHLKNVGPIRHCEPPHAARFTLPFTRCRYCRTPPAHRCPQQHRKQRQQTTTTTTRDRGDRYGPMEWAQVVRGLQCVSHLPPLDLIYTDRMRYTRVSRCTPWKDEHISENTKDAAPPPPHSRARLMRKRESNQPRGFLGHDVTLPWIPPPGARSGFIWAFCWHLYDFHSTAVETDVSAFR